MQLALLAAYVMCTQRMCACGFSCLNCSTQLCRPYSGVAQRVNTILRSRSQIGRSPGLPVSVYGAYLLSVSVCDAYLLSHGYCYVSAWCALCLQTWASAVCYHWAQIVMGTTGGVDMWRLLCRRLLTSGWGGGMRILTWTTKRLNIAMSVLLSWMMTISSLVC